MYGLNDGAIAHGESFLERLQFAAPEVIVGYRGGRGGTATGPHGVALGPVLGGYTEVGQVMFRPGYFMPVFVREDLPERPRIAEAVRSVTTYRAG